jgi:hypothetical protein
VDLSVTCASGSLSDAMVVDRGFVAGVVIASFTRNHLFIVFSHRAH